MYPESPTLFSLTLEEMVPYSSHTSILEPIPDLSAMQHDAPRYPMRMFPRRQLGKTMAGSIAAASTLAAALTPERTPATASSSSLQWQLIFPGIWRATVGVPEAHSPVRSRLIGPATGALAALPAIHEVPLEGASSSIDRRGVSVVLPLAAGELMYGFGLQLLSFQQRGKKRTIRVNADPKGDSGDSHAPVPFYVTTRGYGILVDTFRHADFYVGDVYPTPTAPQKNGEAKVNVPADVQVHDGSKQASVRVEVPRSTGI